MVDLVMIGRVNKPFFRHLFRPELENPIFVEGLPGLGNVGSIVAQLLIKRSRAKPFSELYSPYFPDYVIVGEDGICRPPLYEFYASKIKDSHLIILTGDMQPSLDDVMAHYELCCEILDFVEQYGCRFVVTMGGVPRPQPEKEVYVAATSSNLALEAVKKGALLFGGGKIMGATGLLLGLAKSRGWNGLCMLGATTGTKVDREAALSLYEFLMKVLRTRVEENFESHI